MRGAAIVGMRHRRLSNPSYPDLRSRKVDHPQTRGLALARGYGSASWPGSAGAVLHRIVDDDRTTGGVVGDISSHLLALRRRPRRSHGGSVSELGLENRE